MSVCATIQYVPGASSGPDATGSVFQPAAATASPVWASSAPGSPVPLLAYRASRMCALAGVTPTYTDSAVSVPGVASVNRDPLMYPKSESSFVPAIDVRPKTTVGAGVLVAVGVPTVGVFVTVGVAVLVAVLVAVGVGPPTGAPQSVLGVFRYSTGSVKPLLVPTVPHAGSLCGRVSALRKPAFTDGQVARLSGGFPAR
ncbi:MAG: hypothetical protein ACYC9X_07605, partial [Dehalococcoidia bacterium]